MSFTQSSIHYPLSTIALKLSTNNYALIFRMSMNIILPVIWIWEEVLHSGSSPFPYAFIWSSPIGIEGFYSIWFVFLVFGLYIFMIFLTIKFFVPPLNHHPHLFILVCIQIHFHQIWPISQVYPSWVHLHHPPDILTKSLLYAP